MAEEQQPDEITKLREELRQVLDESKTLLKELKEQKIALIEGDEGKLSLMQMMTTAKLSSDSSADAIRDLHKELFEPAEEGAEPLATQLKAAITAIREDRIKVQQNEKRAKDLNTILFGGKDGDGNEVKGLKSEMEERAEQLKELHSKIFDKPAEDRLPLSKEVGDFLEEFTKKKGDIEGIRKEIAGYHDELLGTLQEDGKRTGGIRDHIAKESLDHTTEYTAKDKRQKELMDRVDALLAGASTAALGKAFNLHKTSFDQSNKRWMQVFVGSVALIIAVPLVALIWPKMLDLPWWEQLLVRLPIIGGAITLAWYASKQRSQNRRLQQEYAYKEDVAMIYIALKKEIEDLGENPLSAKLKEQVLQVLVNSVGYNPSDTLDSSAHDDKGPAHEAYKKGMDAVTDIVKEVVPKIVKAGS